MKPLSCLLRRGAFVKSKKKKKKTMKTSRRMELKFLELIRKKKRKTEK